MSCTTRPSPRRRMRRAASAALMSVALTCGGTSAAAQAASSTTAAADEGSTADTTSPGYADNPFIPENQNFGDCASSLPRPDCGSEARGGVPQLLTMAALMLGMAFIGWRISVGVRKRDRRRDPDEAPRSDPVR